MTTDRAHWRTFADEAAGTYTEAGFGERDRLTGRPGLVIVDCTYAFIGSHPNETLAEAMKQFPTVCGPVGWEALIVVAELLNRFREQRLPIVFSRSDLAVWPALGGATKAGLRRRGLERHGAEHGNQFPSSIAPSTGELVVEKSRASIFFNTPLAGYLRARGVDSLVICGATTSGCVRASVVDAFSHGFTTFVAEDGCFDRSWQAHRADLWDMHAKYATVDTASSLLQQLRSA